ncbi:MAG: thermonuclease family protein [Clostridia bacterium]|nr:thermonuclease family protein [Clostridia bacterium]
MGSDIIKNILKYIPGFRTRTLWKMVIASLYYLFAISMAASGIGYMLTSLSLPFVIFSIIEMIKKKKSGFPVKNSIISFFIALLVFITGSLLTPETKNSNLLLQKEPLNTPTASPREKTNENNTLPTPVPSPQTNLREKVTVTRVIDGDTFEIEGGRSVRLIGVDTPESVHPDQSKNTEFGKIASAFTKEKLGGKTVYLEKDVSDKDKYGRLLRYVYLEDNTFFNEYLIKEGMANPATFPPDVKYTDLFVKAQQYAKSNNKGLWAIDEQKTQKNPQTVPESKQNAGNQFGGAKTYTDASGKGLIKGNINSKGEKIYHLPGGQFYDRTVPEAWFKTEEEARAAGFRRSQR